MLVICVKSNIPTKVTYLDTRSHIMKTLELNVASVHFKQLIKAV